MFKIGIIGDTGMVGQEIEKLLNKHDKTTIIYRRNSKREVGAMEDCDIIFLATKDKESMHFSELVLNKGVRVIDMSGAFRLDKELFETWYKLEHDKTQLFDNAVYGMPALFRDEIAKAQLVANPGCYATSAILALHPLKDILKDEISIVATSGNSGARRDVEDISNEITYSYGRQHKHVPEIEKYTGFTVDFTPIVLRSVERGINTNIRGKLKDDYKGLDNEKVVELIENTIRNSYVKEDCIQVVRDSVTKSYGTRDVNNTHNMLIKVRVDSNIVYINSLIDNLQKGAASQGVENMNIMLGLPRLYSL